MNRIPGRCRRFTLGTCVTVGLVAACETAPGGASDDARQPVAEGVKLAPIFEVDPFWPEPLPNHWVTGSTIGLAVDAQDNVWTIHRPGTVEDNFRAADLTAGEAMDEEVAPGGLRRNARSDPVGACCRVAPPILVCDKSGGLVRAWGGPGDGYDWPDSNHGITVDHEGNVWLGGNGRDGTQILKFTGDGEFLMQNRHPRRA